MIGYRVHTFRLIGNDIDTSHLVGHTAAKGNGQYDSQRKQIAAKKYSVRLK
jgi:hypothetical protein